MASPNAVVESTVIVELREQLLAWERELDERENALVARLNGVVEVKRALGRVRMECDADHDRAGAVQQDYRARLCASTTGRRHSLEFDRVLSGY
jgi:hypothetical protein